MSIRLPFSAVLASLLLHAVFSAPFFLPGKSGVRTTEVAFLDLSSEIPVAAAPSPPPKAAAAPKEEVKGAPKPAPRVVTKTPEAPAQEREPEEPPAAELQTAEESSPFPDVQEPPALAAEAPSAPAQSDLVLGLSRGFFQTLGSGRTLLPEVRDYYLAMLERVNRRWWGEEVDHRSIRREVMAVVIIGRNGLLLDGWIARSSGDPLLDELVLGTIRAASPFPPLPEGIVTDYFQAPIRLVPPVAPGLGSPEPPPHGGGFVPPT